MSEISLFKAFDRLPLQLTTKRIIVSKIEIQKARGALKVNKVFCLFEQSGTFKNEFIKLGIPAEDFDLLNEFGQTDHVIDLFSEIRGGTKVRKAFLTI